MTSPAPSALRNIPPSQNTAPVHEFACLYTHDLRRKQKRWQDGFLKFHTFNKRAMVYDQSRNHVGDTHWKEGNQLQEGDELTLENGVIVEVAEPKLTTQTDLTPILQKRPRDGAAGNGHSPRNSKFTVPGARSGGVRSSAVSQPLNRPLSAVLGTAKGPLGKAQLPLRSPFEERQANQTKDWAVMERTAKRQRVAEVGHAWNAAKDLRTPVPKSRAHPLCEYSDAGRVATAPPLFERQTPLAQGGRSRAAPQDVIDITSDAEEPMSDVTIPNTPPNLSHHALFPGSRQFQNPTLKHVPKVTAAVPESRPRKGLQERLLARSPSPPVSTTSKVTGVQTAIEARIEAPTNAETSSDGQPPSPQRKTLKLRAGPRKKMLFCQPAAPQYSDVSLTLSSRNVSRPNEQSVQNSSGGRHVRRHSEIPKLDNGLTPSSPPEEVGIFPETNGPQEDASRYRPNSCSDRIPKSFSERDAQLSNGFERAATHGRKGQPVVKEVASKAEMPQSHGRKAAPTVDAADKAISTLHKRHGRSEPSIAAKAGSATRFVVATTKSRNPILKRSASLNIAVPPKAARRESTPPSPPADKDVGPWSTEAVDLFDWRPPGYVFQGQGKGFAPAEVQAGDIPQT